MSKKSWRCENGWHRWMFESMTDVRTVATPGRSLPICTLTERCYRCNLKRTTSGITPPKHPPVMMKAVRGVTNRHSWDSLHSIVRQGIHANTEADSRYQQKPPCRCGCHVRGADWFLCQYHEGMQDGVDLLMDELTVAAHADMTEQEEPIRLTDRTGGGA